MIFLCIAFAFHLILDVNDTGYWMSISTLNCFFNTMPGICQKYMNMYLFRSYVFHDQVVKNIIKKVKKKNGLKNVNSTLWVGFMVNERTYLSQIKEEKHKFIKLKKNREKSNNRITNCSSLCVDVSWRNFHLGTRLLWVLVPTVQSKPCKLLIVVWWLEHIWLWLKHWIEGL